MQTEDTPVLNRVPPARRPARPAGVADGSKPARNQRREAAPVPTPLMPQAVPFRIWWREVRCRVLPLVFFLAVLAAVILLWCNQTVLSIVW